MALIKSYDTDSQKGSKDYRYYSQQSSDPATNISKYIYLNKKINTACNIRLLVMAEIWPAT